MKIKTMPRTRTRPTRRATIAGIAAHQPHAYRAKYSLLGAIFYIVGWALRAIVGLWALYWFFVILIHLMSPK
jgi:hypothetical protein